ncbi:MAG TPA: hypothetical protein VFT12_07525, partial [Thermoanaerobaculia bacterium]|nr:hypothetical protein [Thermoanaerobaculia bacterium]
TPSTGRLTGTIDGNTIGESGVQRSGAGCNSCSGVTVTAAGHGVVSADITTNVIQQTGGSAIVATAGPGGPRLRLSLRSNLLRQPAGTSAPAIRVGSAVTATDTSDVCLTIGGTGAHANTIEGSWGEHGAIQLLHRFGAARFLIDSLSGGNDEAAVAAFVAQVNRGAAVRAFLRPDSRERGFEPSAGCPVTASP